jgi:hypothetical protein
MALSPILDLYSLLLRGKLDRPDSAIKGFLFYSRRRPDRRLQCRADFQPMVSQIGQWD